MTHPSIPAIKSHANPNIRRVMKLRDNRQRRKMQRFLVDGWRETSLALQAGMELISLYLSVDHHELLVQSNHQTELGMIRKARETDSLTFVTESIANKIAFGQSPRGVVAEFVEPASNLAAIRLTSNPLILILDQIEKPGNLGAIFRTGDAAGVDAILLCESTDRFNPNAIRNSQGAVFHVPSACGTQSEIAAFLNHHSIIARAARVESSDILWQTDLSKPTAIILGNEANGLGGRWQEYQAGPIRGIRIPMQGKTDSLNVSVTAAIMAMEAARQRSVS